MKFTDAQNEVSIRPAVDSDGLIELHVETIWDTYIRVDLSPADARKLAAELLELAK
jgi:hypothetical protein